MCLMSWTGIMYFKRVASSPPFTIINEKQYKCQHWNLTRWTVQCFNSLHEQEHVLPPPYITISFHDNLMCRDTSGLKAGKCNACFQDLVSHEHCLQAANLFSAVVSIQFLRKIFQVSTCYILCHNILQYPASACVHVCPSCSTWPRGTRYHFIQLAFYPPSPDTLDIYTVTVKIFRF